MHKYLHPAAVTAGFVFFLGGALSCTPPSSNTTPSSTPNTAAGFNALTNNTEGAYNTAIGSYTLSKNTTTSYNTAVGGGALQNTATGGSNTAVGFNALSANTGGYTNTAVGNGAGTKLTNGHDNIYLGHEGIDTESNTMRLGQTQTTTFIAGVTGTPVVGSQVLITSDGQLGTLASSTRYKRDIQDMGERSRKLQQLRPVTFRYRQDQQGVQQYGLIAEEVAQIYPELVVRNANGEVETIQYHELIPMLLNEHQHQEQEIQELKTQNVRQQQEIGVLKTALLQQNAKIAARLTQLETAARTATVASR